MKLVFRPTAYVFLVSLLWLSLPELAMADNCGSFSDCYRTAQAAIMATTAGAIIATIISFAIGFVPYVGTGKGLLESFLGFDVITGKPLEDWEQAVGLGGSYGTSFKHMGKIAGHISKSGDELFRTTSRIIDRAFDVSSKIVDKGGKIADGFGAGYDVGEIFFHDMHSSLTSSIDGVSLPSVGAPSSLPSSSIEQIVEQITHTGVKDYFAEALHYMPSDVSLSELVEVLDETIAASEEAVVKDAFKAIKDSLTELPSDASLEDVISALSLIVGLVFILFMWRGLVVLQDSRRGRWRFR